MPYNQNLADFRYMPTSGPKRHLIDLVAKAMEMDQAQNQSRASVRATDLNSDFNEQSMPYRVDQEANTATHGGLVNEGIVAERADGKDFRAFLPQFLASQKTATPMGPKEMLDAALLHRQINPYEHYQATNPKEVEAKTKNYQMVKNRQGVMEAIDQTTGLNPQGQPVQAWIDPVKPDPNLLPPGTIVEGLDPIPGVRITKDSAAKVKGATTTYRDLKAQIAEYRDLYNQFGTEGIGSNAELMKAKATGLKLTMKELENLGVLNGPDLMLMNEMVPDAGGILAKSRGLMNPVLGNSFLPNLKQLEDRVETRYNSTLSSNGFQRAAPDAGPKAIASEADYNALPPGTEFTDPQGNVRRKP